MSLENIKSKIKNRKVLSLLESQFPIDTEFGLELVEERKIGKHIYQKYRLQIKKPGDLDFDRDRFFIRRTYVNGQN